MTKIKEQLEPRRQLFYISSLKKKKKLKKKLIGSIFFFFDIARMHIYLLVHIII